MGENLDYDQKYRGPSYSSSKAGCQSVDARFKFAALPQMAPPNSPPEITSGRQPPIHAPPTGVYIMLPLS